MATIDEFMESPFKGVKVGHDQVMDALLTNLVETHTMMREVLRRVIALEHAHEYGQVDLDRVQSDFASVRATIKAESAAVMADLLAQMATKNKTEYENLQNTQTPT